MANITVTLFWDMDLRKWTTTLGGTTEQGPIQGLVQGDKVLFNVKFVQSGAAVTLTSPVFTASAIKAQGDFTGSYLIQLSAPTGSPPLYTFTVDPLNSANLNTFLQTYRNTWCALEIYDSANGILTTPLELQITPGYSLSGTPTDNAPGEIVVAAGKTATISNSITLTGTDGTTYNLNNLGGLTLNSTTTTGFTAGRILYSDGSVVQQYAISGTGSVAMTNSPTFVTPALGAATATSINGRKQGVQYLTASAVWDGSSFVTSDGGNYTLSFAGITGSIFFQGKASSGVLTISNSPGGLLDGAVSPDGNGNFFAWVNAAGNDGSVETYL